MERIAKLVGGEHRGNGRDRGLVVLPGRARRFVAGGPGFSNGIVSPRIFKLQARTSRVWCGGPGLLVEIADFIRRIASRIQQANAIGGVRQFPGIISSDRHVGITLEEVLSIPSHHQIRGRRHFDAGRKTKVDRVSKSPACKRHGVLRPVVELDPFLVVLGILLAGKGGGKFLADVQSSGEKKICRRCHRELMHFHRQDVFAYHERVGGNGPGNRE